MMATSPTSEVREAISRLIDICRWGQEGFEIAARGVSEPILRAELLQYSGQRQEFVAELNDALRQLGEEPFEQAAAPLSSPSGWNKLKQAIACSDRAAILGECERAEQSAVEAYRTAAVAGLPSVLNGTVNVQLQAINRVHDRVQSLRDFGTPT